MKRETKTLIDTDTGEIIENVVSFTTAKQDDYLKEGNRIKKERANYVSKYGNFYFMTYPDERNTYSEDVKHIDSARLIYLASFMDYDTILKHDNGMILRKEDLMNLLGLSKNIFYEFYNRVVALGVLIENDDYSISVNEGKFIKGKIDTKNEYTRLFIHAVRTLYENCTAKQHKHLGKIYDLIPYVNYKHNILCSNPHERSYELIINLTLADINNVFGFTKMRIKEVIGILSEFKINSPKGEMNVFSYVSVDGDIENSKIMVNPLLMFSGLTTDMERVVLLFTQNQRAVAQKLKGTPERKALKDGLERNRLKSLKQREANKVKKINADNQDKIAGNQGK